MSFKFNKPTFYQKTTSSLSHEQENLKKEEEECRDRHSRRQKVWASSYLDIKDLNYFSREDLQDYEGEPDFMVSSAHLKELLSAPYNHEKTLSLKVCKDGETLKINRMHPLTGNTKGAQKYFKNDPEFVTKIEQIHEKQLELYF
jgi:hypothetical protein